MKEKIRILLAEDEESMGTLLCEYLNMRGYDTDLYADGELALKGFYKKKYDLCILDVMMPKKDGFAVAQSIRTMDHTIPIIFLTAKAMRQDVIRGFAFGADDYLTKPFSIDELIARMDALLRRIRVVQENNSHDSFKIGKYTFDYFNRRLKIGDKEISLMPKEAEILQMLCMNRNQVLDRNAVLMQVWDNDSIFNARSMDIYMTKIRKHLSEDENIRIVNIYGRGFKLVD
ncbi:MAG: response regulator transcription factor [Prevotellaceae bacterium]|jgi:DNA-binding response OmpR family regulator|nr:response regulator transcription factor [Prevotellaceae bacterium]